MAGASCFKQNQLFKRSRSLELDKAGRVTLDKSFALLSFSLLVFKICVRQYLPHDTVVKLNKIISSKALQGKSKNPETTNSH